MLDSLIARDDPQSTKSPRSVIDQSVDGIRRSAIVKKKKKFFINDIITIDCYKPS